jgi:hypothetical protein
VVVWESEERRVVKSLAIAVVREQRIKESV